VTDAERAIWSRVVMARPTAPQGPGRVIDPCGTIVNAATGIMHTCGCSLNLQHLEAVDLRKLEIEQDEAGGVIAAPMRVADGGSEEVVERLRPSRTTATGRRGRRAAPCLAAARGSPDREEDFRYAARALGTGGRGDGEGIRAHRFRAAGGALRDPLATRPLRGPAGPPTLRARTVAYQGCYTRKATRTFGGGVGRIERLGSGAERRPLRLMIRERALLSRRSKHACSTT
jgi:hypothetical protein